MALQIELNEQQLADLAVLRDLGAERVQRMIDLVERLEPTPLGIGQFQKEIPALIDDPEVDNQRVLAPLLGLCRLMREEGLNSEQILGMLRRGLELAPRKHRWTSEQLAAWKTLEPRFEILLSLRRLSTIVKSLELAYDYANLLRNTRIVTDIRPVFSEDAKEVEGAVISHTLRLSFSNLEGDHGLSIALDKKDVEVLKGQCERALIKAETSKLFMKQDAGKPAMVAGEQQND